jgi:hypothetical protein
MMACQFNNYICELADGVVNHSQRKLAACSVSEGSNRSLMLIIVEVAPFADNRQPVKPEIDAMMRLSCAHELYWQSIEVQN